MRARTHVRMLARIHIYASTLKHMCQMSLGVKQSNGPHSAEKTVSTSSGRQQHMLDFGAVSHIPPTPNSGAVLGL